MKTGDISILNLLSGILGLPWIGLIGLELVYGGGGESQLLPGYWPAIIVVIGFAAAFVAFIGGLLSLLLLVIKRNRRFILASSIAAVVCFPILGIASILLFAKRTKELKR